MRVFSHSFFYVLYPTIQSFLFKQKRTRFAPWWTPTPGTTASYRSWWRWGWRAAIKVLSPTGYRASLLNRDDVSRRCLSTGSMTCWSGRGSSLRTWQRICMMDKFCRSSLVRISSFPSGSRCGLYISCPLQAASWITVVMKYLQAFFSQPNVETTFFSYQKREELTRNSRPENMKNSNNNFNNKSPLYDTIASHVFFFSNTFLKW